MRLLLTLLGLGGSLSLSACDQVAWLGTRALISIAVAGDETPSQIQLSIYDKYGLFAKSHLAGGPGVVAILLPDESQPLRLAFSAPMHTGPIRGALTVNVVVGTSTSAAVALAATVADSDGDEVADSIDNCVAVADHEQTDTDGDGRGDVCQPTATSTGDLAVETSVDPPAAALSADLAPTPPQTDLAGRGPALALLGVNLIKNPGAEASVGANLNETVPLSNWTVSGTATPHVYGSTDFLTTTAPGPPVRGNNFFAGGVGMLSSANQRLDLMPLRPLLDEGRSFVLSGYFGGWQADIDYATLTLRFEDEVGTVISVHTIGPVTATDRGSVSRLALRTLSGTVPVGTRGATVELTFTRAAPTYNDGYADELSLIFQ